MIAFTLLGQVALLDNGEPLQQFRSQKELALLVYLAHTGQAHTRDFIAELLWEDRSVAQMRSNLRTALSRLRGQVGDALVVTRTTLRLAPESVQPVDSADLLHALTSFGPVDSAEKAADLQEILDAYSGDFLANFVLSDAPLFETWALTTREQIRRQVVSALHKAGQHAQGVGDGQQAIAIARRWLAVDGLDEAAHSLLIRGLLQTGNQREAVAQYEACVTLLSAELDVAPSTELTALIREAQPRRAPAIRPPQTQRHNLPTAYDQFFGRALAQQEIHSRLDQSWCRLVTIAGQGGVGKTRLALTVARTRLERYPDGVWLVELAEIDPDDTDLAEAIAIEIATAVDLRLSGSARPAEQLLTHLQQKQMLLVLDNFEHILGGIQIVLDILQRCEGVQLLITSREAMRIRAEWTIALTGLNSPTSDSDATPSDAVDLFVARRAQQRRGSLSSADLTAIRAICRRVEGLPLALELAAALTQEATSQEIAAQIEQDFDRLAASLRDVPERHRSLHIVFQMSWGRLTRELQVRLARLAIFRGGFDPGAAGQIAQADGSHLAALQEKSLLTYSPEADRYALHPVVRAYAEAKRPSDDLTPHRHADYYLSLLAEHAQPLQGSTPQKSVAVLLPDLDNVRLAWQTALAGRRVVLLLAGLPALSVVYQLRGLAREAEEVMQSTASRSAQWGAEALPLAARASLEQARFQNRLGRNRPAIQTVGAALALAAQSGDAWAEGMGHVLWGESLWRLGEYDLSASKLTHALAIGQAIESNRLIGWSHHHLGIIDDIQGRYASALDHLQQACDAWRAIDNAQALSNSLNSVGLVRHNQGDLSAAQQAMEQALAICEQIDDRHRQAHLINNLSMMATEQGNYADAHYYLQIGLDLATVTGNLFAQGALYNNLGKNYRLLGDLDASEKALVQGMPLMESIGDPMLRATALFYLAETKQAQGDVTEAESCYRQALEIARRDHLEYIACEILIGMAGLWRKQDEEKARQPIAEAVALAETLQNAHLLKRATTIANYLQVSVDVEERPSV